MERFAILDFDGTLSKGFISMAFIEYLHVSGAYSEECYKEQMEILKMYKNKELPYDDWCERWGVLLAEGLRGRRTDDISKQASSFFETFKPNIHMSSYELVHGLKELGFVPVLMSMSAYEAVSLAAKDLGIGIVYGTVSEKRDGTYTGRVETGLHLPGGKEEALRRFSAKSSLEGSIGFGDSISDRGMLEMVGVSIALNPTEELKRLAEKRHWQILTSENVMDWVRERIRKKAEGKNAKRIF
jgi:phosphoserine phosphatase